MTGPGPADLAGVGLPRPDLATLTSKWQECLVLPPHPSIPPGTRMWHRRTAEGYLSCVISQVQGLYQVQLLHHVVGQLGAVDLEGLEGRPPTIAELADVLARFTRPGMLFLLFLVAPKTPDLPWPNPVLIGCSQVDARALPIPPDAMPAHRGRH